MSDLTYITVICFHPNAYLPLSNGQAIDPTELVTTKGLFERTGHYSAWWLLQFSCGVYAVGRSHHINENLKPSIDL